MLSGRTKRPAAFAKHSKMPSSSSAFAVAALLTILPRGANLGAGHVHVAGIANSSPDIIHHSHQEIGGGDGNHTLHEAAPAVRTFSVDLEHRTGSRTDTPRTPRRIPQALRIVSSDFVAKPK